MSETQGSSSWDTIFSELLMISYLCGYPGGAQREGPRLGSLKEIMDKCIGLGPYGYGLALYALIIALSGGTIPYWSVMPVPFGSVGRITDMCTVHGALLRKEGVTEDEGFFTVLAMEEAGEDEDNIYMASYPDVFAVVVSYRDAGDRENTRVFLVQHTSDPAYPWMSVIPSDASAEKIIRLCRENRLAPGPDDLVSISYPVPKRVIRGEEEIVDEELIEEE